MKANKTEEKEVREDDKCIKVLNGNGKEMHHIKEIISKTAPRHELGRTSEADYMLLQVLPKGSPE